MRGGSIRFDFRGQVALVTGGTKGIGAQIARDLQHAGARVLITGTQSDSFQPQPLPTGADVKPLEFLAADFSDRDSTLQLMSQLERYERIDVLVNNAGVNRINNIDETKIEDWDYLASVNLEAPILLTRAVGKLMKHHSYGRMVNIGSIFGVISKTKRALYSVTKHGIHGLTIAAALDLAPYGVLVNTVSPGFVLTNLTKSILSPEEVVELAKQVPLGRFADPSDISSLVVFLVSPENRYVTSQNIIVDGGYVNS